MGKVSPRNTATLAELARLPLILPERTHAIRKLLETQAALAGCKLNVALEISSVQSILDLARAGHAVLTPSALAASGAPTAFRLRPLVEPRLTCTLCLGVSAHKPATPLSKHVFRMLHELVIAAGRAQDPPQQNALIDGVSAPRRRVAGTPLLTRSLNCIQFVFNNVTLHQEAVP